MLARKKDGSKILLKSKFSEPKKKILKMGNFGDLKLFRKLKFRRLYAKWGLGNYFSKSKMIKWEMERGPKVAMLEVVMQRMSGPMVE